MMNLAKLARGGTTRAFAARGYVSIDGVRVPPREATVSFFDTSVQRGNGAFEVVRVLAGGRLRAPELHLERLARTAAAIELPLPPRAALKSWLAEAAASQGGREGSVRLVATRGGTSLPLLGGAGGGLGEEEAHWEQQEQEIAVPPRVAIAFERLPAWPASMSLMPLCAPWHTAGADGWETAKWTSYGANIASTRKAQGEGFDDALLLAPGATYDGGGGGGGLGGAAAAGVVLDGPNFAVGWLRNGVFEAPGWAELGMLQSTSMTLALDAAASLGVPVAEGSFTLEQASAADEMVVLSSSRDLVPVAKLGVEGGGGGGGGGATFDTGGELAAALRAAMVSDAVLSRYE